MTIAELQFNGLLEHHAVFSNKLILNDELHFTCCISKKEYLQIIAENLLHLQKYTVLCGFWGWWNHWSVFLGRCK